MTLLARYGDNLQVLIVAALLGSGIMIAFREPMKRRHKRMQESSIAPMHQKGRSESSNTER